MARELCRFKVGEDVAVPGNAGVGTIVRVISGPRCSYEVAVWIRGTTASEQPVGEDEQEQMRLLMNQQELPTSVFAEDELQPIT